MQFENFSESFCKNPGLFVQIPKLVMSLDYIPKKRKW